MESRVGEVETMVEDGAAYPFAREGARQRCTIVHLRSMDNLTAHIGLRPAEGLAFHPQHLMVGGHVGQVGKGAAYHRHPTYPCHQPATVALYGRFAHRRIAEPHEHVDAVVPTLGLLEEQGQMGRQPMAGTNLLCQGLRRHSPKKCRDENDG